MKVKFLGKNGYDFDKEKAKAYNLVKGQILTVTDIDVGNSHTRLTFEGYGSGWNSVMFEGTEDGEYEIELEEAFERYRNEYAY